MKKFLLISSIFPPMNVVGSLRPYRICRYLPLRGWIPQVITTYPWKGFSPDHSLLKAVPSCVKINRTKFFSAISLYQQVRKLVSQTPSGCHEDKATAAHSRSTQDGQNFLHDMLSRLKKSLLGLVSGSFQCWLKVLKFCFAKRISVLL